MIWIRSCPSSTAVDDLGHFGSGRVACSVNATVADPVLALSRPEHFRDNI